jgi:lipoate-protein ligase B
MQVKTPGRQPYAGISTHFRAIVCRLEEAVLRTLAVVDVDVTGHRLRPAPGIHVRRADLFYHAALADALASQFQRLRARP